MSNEKWKKKTERGKVEMKNRTGKRRKTAGGLGLGNRSGASYLIPSEGGNTHRKSRR
jgi:hypothetical protein